MLVVKIGGSVRDAGPLLEDVARCDEQLVLVHGASRDLNELSERLGHPPRHVTSERGEVSRYTDSLTMDHFLMAYAGRVNKRIVERLRSLGVDAVGLTAMDGGTAVGRRRPHLRIREGGKVKVLHDDHAGSIDDVDPRLVRLLLDSGYQPVLSPPAVTRAGEAINVDGDRLSMRLAAALGATRLLIFADTPGFLADPADGSTAVARMRRGDVEERLTGAAGRVRIKLRVAAEGLDRGLEAVVLADGRSPAPLGDALSGAGTWIVA